MSKDMLGSLVRASVQLTQTQVNLALDVVNRFTSKEGPAWEAHVKSILRAGLPNQSKPSVLKLINASIHLDAVTAYDLAELNTRPGLWVSDGFVSRIRSKAKPVGNLGPLSLSSHELMENAYDRHITPALGEEYTFDEFELCVRIDQMIAKQPNGEEGDLLNNGQANIFYVAGSAVFVSWLVVDQKWIVGVAMLDNSTWGTGYRVFSRN